MTKAVRRQLLSVHDLAPAAMPRVRQILDELHSVPSSCVTLLVIPDSGWTEPGIQELRTLAGRGYALAAHGWSHSVREIRSVRHRVHSQFISRRAAEHLALSAAEIMDLIQRSRRWFQENGLGCPDLYVPPAWALGAIPRSWLARTGFRHIETLAGVHDTRHGAFCPLPLTGFEADTVARTLALRAWNRVNELTAGTRRPLRVAIHPNDLHLRLADQLRRIVLRKTKFLSYTELSGNRPGLAQNPA